MPDKAPRPRSAHSRRWPAAGTDGVSARKEACLPVSFWPGRYLRGPRHLPVRASAAARRSHRLPAHAVQKHIHPVCAAPHPAAPGAAVPIPARHHAACASSRHRLRQGCSSAPHSKQSPMRHPVTSPPRPFVAAHGVLRSSLPHHSCATVPLLVRISGFSPASSLAGIAPRQPPLMLAPHAAVALLRYATKERVVPAFFPFNLYKFLCNSRASRAGQKQTIETKYFHVPVAMCPGDENER